MDARGYSWQVRVIGCGECGAKIAAVFDKKPSFLPRRTEDLYPIRCDLPLKRIPLSKLELKTV